jgi:hypothetical protein
MIVEQLAEIRFAHPAVDAVADLDTDGLGHGGRAPEPRGEIDLAEPALAEQPFDPVAQAGFRARDQLIGDEEILRLEVRDVDGERPPRGPRGRGHLAGARGSHG